MTHELVLTGLDGQNPLGLLAALGALRVAERVDATTRLSWRDEGRWRPVLYGEVSRASLVAAVMADRATWLDEPALELTYGEDVRDLKPPPSTLRGWMLDVIAAAGPSSRRTVDLAAAFFTEVATDNKGNIKPTALHFTAGQQAFLRMARQLRDELTEADVEEALWGPWTYARPLPVLAWDAAGSRDYALRASNPASEKKLGVPGADWLALLGLDCLPVVPVGDEAKTTGVRGGWKSGRFTWPLWTVPIARPVIRSLLADRHLRDQDGPTRAARGVGPVWESAIKRSDQGGYGTFAPARLAEP